MEWHVFVVVIFLLSVDSLHGNDELRPPVLWDPYHPIFRCKDPIVYVNANDRIPFLCPNKDLSSNPNTKSTSTIYEKAYLLNYDQEEDYRNCNATNSLAEVVSCEGDISNTPLRLRIHNIRKDDVTFTEGKTYYIIGTSFREKNYWNNRTGGSCNKVENSMQRNLRLRVHVCSEEDKKNRTCKLCTTEACYYNDCGKNCTNWVDDSLLTQQPECKYLQTRTCNYMLLDSKNVVEYRKVTKQRCPVMPGAAPIGGTNENDNDDEARLYKYLCIGIAVLVLIGIAGGLLYYRTRQNHSNVEPTTDKPMSQKNAVYENGHGQVNLSFDES